MASGSRESSATLLRRSPRHAEEESRAFTPPRSRCRAEYSWHTWTQAFKCRSTRNRPCALSVVVVDQSLRRSGACRSLVMCSPIAARVAAAIFVLLGRLPVWPRLERSLSAAAISSVERSSICRSTKGGPLRRRSGTCIAACCLASISRLSSSLSGPALIVRHLHLTLARRSAFFSDTRLLASIFFLLDQVERTVAGNPVKPRAKA